jgi:hypothetical protein
VASSAASGLIRPQIVSEVMPSEASVKAGRVVPFQRKRCLGRHQIGREVRSNQLGRGNRMHGFVLIFAGMTGCHESHAANGPNPATADAGVHAAVTPRDPGRDAEVEQGSVSASRGDAETADRSRDGGVDAGTNISRRMPVDPDAANQRARHVPTPECCGWQSYSSSSLIRWNRYRRRTRRASTA